MNDWDWLLGTPDFMDWGSLRRRQENDALTKERLALLQRDSLYVSGFQNALAGYGYDVGVLEAHGFVQKDEYDPKLEGCRYRLTTLGNEERERQRVADLAAIGVYEIRETEAAA